jgi:hypothetical protein
MLPNIPQTDFSDYRQLAVWIISMAVVAFGFKYAKEVIAFVLDELYRFFIQNNPAGT